MKLHLTFLRNEGEALMTHSHHVSACSMYSRIQHCSSHLHWVVLQHSTDTQYNLMLSHLRWSLFSAFEKHLLFFLYECSRFYQNHALHWDGTVNSRWRPETGFAFILYQERSFHPNLHIRKNTSCQVRNWGHTHKAHCSIDAIKSVFHLARKNAQRRISDG